MDDASTYIRGARTDPVEARRVLLVVAWLLAASLVVLSVYLILATAHRNSSNANLRDHGVGVQVTVTGCDGISDGIGMGIEYWECRGSFRVDGRTYTEVIQKSRVQRPPGQVLDAVVVPTDPASLALETSHDSSYALGIVVGAATILYIAALVRWGRRPKRGQPVAASAK